MGGLFLFPGKLKQCGTSHRNTPKGPVPKPPQGPTPKGKGPNPERPPAALKNAQLATKAQRAKGEG